MTRAIVLMVVAISACTPSVTPPPPSTPAPPTSTPQPPLQAAPPPETPDEPPAELKVSQLDDEPIAFTGHGALFDRNGKQIPVTLAFVEYAQRYYHDQMAGALRGKAKQDFEATERSANASLDAKGQEALVLQSETLEWLLDALPDSPYKQRAARGVHSLKAVLQWVLPEQDDLKVVEKRGAFEPRPEVRKRLETLGAERQKKGPIIAKLATGNFGQAYIDECAAAGVPIPPSINVLDPNGVTGWKSQGFIPQSEQFIVGSPAELRSWKSASPEGMCYALPRYSDASKTVVNFDGVICLGKQTSNVCFWDNQKAVNPASGVSTTFSYGAGEVIPIGVPSTPGGKYQGGGKEIEFNNVAGICTDCHAGENPFIVHPETNLGSSLWKQLSAAPQNLPTKGVNRYVPHVAPSWPQNTLSQVKETMPGSCQGCHVKASAGRLPHLSNLLGGYCFTILAQAIDKTMPQGTPGSDFANANNFLNAYCNGPPQADAADSGDPHLTTLNKVHYDFQSAGEFTLIRNVDTAFEVQVRQTPVLTTFGPVADPYSGLNSCVSVNTAVAIGIGKHRLSYESTTASGFAHETEISWFVDGKAVQSAKAIDIEGVKINAPERNPIEIILADGKTKVIVNPIFWSSQGVWYLDVTVLGTTGRSGLIGTVLPGEWLPRPSTGTSLGPMPASLNNRYIALHQKFADSWRVKSSTSLFSYPAGTSTGDYVDRGWPPPPGKPCTGSTIKGLPLVREQRPDKAQVLCQGIKNKEIFADCVLDVATMGGDKAVADAHKKAEQLLP